MSKEGWKCLYCKKHYLRFTEYALHVSKCTKRTKYLSKKQRSVIHRCHYCGFTSADGEVVYKHEKRCKRDL